MKSIQTDNGKFLYKEEELYHGRKEINVEIAKENLFIFNSIMENTKIRYGLFFGTLLGAVRDNGLIEYDEDVDIYILEEDKHDTFNLLFKFREVGLELIRVGDGYVSLMRNDEYIDLYFFRKSTRFFFLKYRTHRNKYAVKESYLTHPIKYELYNKEFYIPNNPEKVLRDLYGNNWKTPIRDYHAPGNTMLLNLFKYLGVYQVATSFYRILKK